MTKPRASHCPIIWSIKESVAIVGRIPYLCVCVSDRPTCLTFCCNKMSKNTEWINKEYCFFIRLGSCAAYQCCSVAFIATAKIQQVQAEIQIFWAPNIAPRCFSTSQKVFELPGLQSFQHTFYDMQKNEIGIYYFVPYRLSNRLR